MIISKEIKGYSIVRIIRAIIVFTLCTPVAFVTVGCSTDESVLVDLGDFSDRHGPLVFSENPNLDVDTHDAATRELSEAHWKILERFAPRSTWQRIRDKKKEILEARQKVARSLPPVSGPHKLPEVITEVLEGDHIQMYYRIRHFGGIGVSVNRDSGLERSKISITKPDFSVLIDLVKQRLAEAGEVTLLPDDNILVIRCHQSAKESVLQLLARIDLPAPQVEITARIFEANHDMDFQAGVRLLLEHMASDGAHGLAANFSAEDFAATAAGAFPASVPDPGSALNLMQTFGRSGWSANATIQALGATGLVKLVSEPRMTVSAGKTAYILTGQEIPLSSARISNDMFITEKTVYKPVGVQLHVTPTVVGPDSVKLHILTVVSAVSGFQKLMNMGGITAAAINPIFDTRETETIVSVPNGSALVIGGLRQSRNIVREDKVPGLGNMPYLGWLFKSHRSQKQLTDLYFFVTPRIINLWSVDESAGVSKPVP